MLGASPEASVLCCKFQETVGGNLPGKPGTCVPVMTLGLLPTKTQILEVPLGLGKIFRKVQDKGKFTGVSTWQWASRRYFGSLFPNCQCPSAGDHQDTLKVEQVGFIAL